MADSGFVQRSESLRSLYFCWWIIHFLHSVPHYIHIS